MAEFRKAFTYKNPRDPHGLNNKPKQVTLNDASFSKQVPRIDKLEKQQEDMMGMLKEILDNQKKDKGAK